VCDLLAVGTVHPRADGGGLAFTSAVGTVVMLITGAIFWLRPNVTAVKIRSVRTLEKMSPMGSNCCRPTQVQNWASNLGAMKTGGC